MRQMRLQVVATADDDGISNKATVTAQTITDSVAAANRVFATTDVEFLFDPVRDFIRINSTVLNRNITVTADLERETDSGSDPKSMYTSAPHYRARRGVAELFPDRITVFFSHRIDLIYDATKGHWVVTDKKAHSSSGTAEWVVMLKDVNSNKPRGATVLAHELGHFLQNEHAFSEPATLAKAQEAIRTFVREQGVDKSEGASAFDNDADRVTDTVPDPGVDLFALINTDVCGANSSLTVKVDFEDGEEPTEYSFTPDRDNLMSYFRCDPQRVRMSTQQQWRVRDTLDTGLRNRLIAARAERLSGTLVRGGEGTLDLGSLSKTGLLSLGNGRVVSVLREAGKFKLVAWDLSPDGVLVHRRGMADAGEVNDFAACYAGLGMVVTAVKSASDQLKLIVWHVDAEGGIRRGDAIDGGALGKDVAISKLGIGLLATASVSPDGSVLLQTWKLPASGKLKRLHGLPYPTIPSSATGVLLAESPTIFQSSGGRSMVEASQITVAVRLGSAELRLALLRVDGKGRISVLAHASGARGDRFGFCSLPPRTLIAATRNPDGFLRLQGWMLEDEGLAIQACDESKGGPVSEVALCPAGLDLVASAVRTQEGTMKLIVWRCIAGGAGIVRFAEAETASASLVSVCQVTPGVLATGVRTAGGDFKLIGWKLG